VRFGRVRTNQRLVRFVKREPVGHSRITASNAATEQRRPHCRHVPFRACRDGRRVCAAARNRNRHGVLDTGENGRVHRCEGTFTFQWGGSANVVSDASESGHRSSSPLLGLSSGDAATGLRTGWTEQEGRSRGCDSGTDALSESRSPGSGCSDRERSARRNRKTTRTALSSARRCV